MDPILLDAIAFSEMYHMVLEFMSNDFSLWASRNRLIVHQRLDIHMEINLKIQGTVSTVITVWNIY